MDTEANSYSSQWFEYFHVGISEARTSREIDFVRHAAALPEFQNILDVCCGMGRHARALSGRDYAVTAIDRDPNAIAKARELGGGPNYVVADIRDFEPAPGSFDAVIVMGQSFGHFDAATNRDVLQRLARAVRKRGLIILDLWNPEFFEANQGERELNTSRGVVRELKGVEEGRLFVQLRYPAGTEERFEWQLFTPKQMEQLAKAVGLHLLVSCNGFDSKKRPSSADPRLQFVLERAK